MAITCGTEVDIIKKKKKKLAELYYLKESSSPRWSHGSTMSIDI